VKFGGPLAVPIGTAEVDGDAALLAFMKEEEASWQLVHSAVTFDAEDGDPDLETAAVRLAFGGPNGATTVAWSMLPESASTPYDVNRGFSLGPEVKLSAVGASAGSIDGAKTHHGEDVYLRAGGLFTQSPEWKFKRTKTVKLAGSYRLVMVARGLRGTTAQLAVTLEGSVRNGRLPGPLKKTTKLVPTTAPGIELTF
jgi:hypothetical protein